MNDVHAPGQQHEDRSGMRRKRAELLWKPLRIVVIFIVVSLVWIVGTDWLVQRFVTDELLEERLQTVKGLTWVVLVAALLFRLLNRTRGEQLRLYERIDEHQSGLEERVRQRTLELRRSQRQLRMLNRESDRVRENERKSLSRELHDRLGSDLTSLKLDLLSIRQHPAADADLVQSVDSALQQVDSMYRKMRELSSQLRPAIIDDFGIVAGLEWLAARFRERSTCECEVAVDAADIPPDEARDTALFRICQEALTNVSRHAHAEHVTIRLRLGDDAVTMQVDDDGCGFEDNCDAARATFGIMGMKERALALGGRLAVTELDEGGVRVEVRVPLRPLAEEALSL